MLLMARALEQIFVGFLHIPASGVFCPGLFSMASRSIVRSQVQAEQRPVDDGLPITAA